MKFNFWIYEGVKDKTDGVFSLSFSFLKRSRCSKCAGVPKRCYRIQDPINFVSSKNIQTLFKKDVKLNRGFIENYFFKSKPSNFTNNKPFKYVPKYTKFRAKLHKNNSKPFERQLLIYCDCGYTSWVFNPISDRPEISCRKSLKK